MFSRKLGLLQRLRQPNHSSSGFTLPELLTTIIISSIAVSSLLGTMVKLISSDRTEAALNQTQQEMQSALNFIAEDLRESVYIYSDLRGLPALGFGETAVLAFWKTEPINANALQTLRDNNCAGFAGDQLAECNALLFRRRAYSLIVYLQSTAPNDTWEGKSRIRRYKLSQYEDVETLTVSQGFVDPADENNFTTWLQENGRNIAVDLRGTAPVLVDFVDDPRNGTVTDVAECEDGYSRLPRDTSKNNSFFVCVRQTANDEGVDQLGVNQDVVVYLRGNAYGRPGINSDRPLSTLQARVTLRGLIDKFN